MTRNGGSATSEGSDCGFDVRAVSVDELIQDRCLVVALAEEPGGTGQALLFQRTLRPGGAVDAQDRLLGMDTYCVSNEAGAAVYGGVTGWNIDDKVLTLRFGPEASHVLGLGRECRFRLLVDGREIAGLAAGLKQVLTKTDEAPLPPFP